MQYAIELFFDQATERKLFHLAERIAEENISTKYIDWKTRPHITLACFNDVDEKRCIEILKQFATNHKVLPAYLGSVAMFNDTRTVFIAPIMNRQMYLFQEELHENMKEFDTTGWEWYCPNRWVPHCGIALTSQDEPEAFFKASELVLREFEKMVGEFTAVGLVKITFPVEEIFTIGLNK